MKAMIKRVIAVGLIVLMCFVFCSCDIIKEMKKQHAVFSKESSEQIVYQGQPYKLLPMEKLPDGVNVETRNMGYLTESDVPVLLSHFFGDIMHYNHNRTIIMYNDLYYCREDVYDYVIDQVKRAYLDKYCVEIFDFETLENRYELVKQRFMDALYYSVFEGEPISNEEIYYDIMTEYSIQIYACDEKMVFQSMIMSVDKYETGDILVHLYDEVYGYGSYLVPDSKKGTVEELFSVVEDAENAGFVL